MFKRVLTIDKNVDDKEGKYSPSNFVLLDKEFEQYMLRDGQLVRLEEPREINLNNRNDFRLIMPTDLQTRGVDLEAMPMKRLSNSDVVFARDYVDRLMTLVNFQLYNEDEELKLQ